MTKKDTEKIPYPWERGFTGRAPVKTQKIKAGSTKKTPKKGK